MGGLGMLLAELVPVYLAQRVLLGVAGLFMLFLGLYLGGWWLGLARIEALGGALWRRIEPHRSPSAAGAHAGAGLGAGA